MTEDEAKLWCEVNHIEIHHVGKKIRLDFIVNDTIEVTHGIAYGRSAFDSVTTGNSLASAVREAQKRMGPYKPKPR